MNQDIKKWSVIAQKYAEATKEDLFRGKFLYPLILKSLGLVKKKIILDAGCATGWFSKLLAQRGARVFAIDGSHEMIEIAKQNDNILRGARTKFFLNRPEYIIADLNKKLNFQDNFFDAICAIHILMDVSNFRDMLFEFYRVLKPKGKLIISVSHPCFTYPTLKWKRGILGRMNKKWGYVKLGDYFPARKVDKPLVDKHFPISHYHRPLQDYINGLIKAGFFITKIQEPKMPSGLAQKTNFFLANRIPMVLIITANTLK